MEKIKGAPSVSKARIRDAVAREVDTASPVTRDYQAAAREKWQQFIDYRLIEWGCDPSQLDDEGTQTPSRKTIQLAIELAQNLRRRGLPAPTRIVPDARGGIVFELRTRENFESIRISADGSVEHCVFVDCRMVQREPWYYTSSTANESV